jgi:hypothetical protein
MIALTRYNFENHSTRNLLGPEWEGVCPRSSIVWRNILGGGVTKAPGQPKIGMIMIGKIFGYSAKLSSFFEARLIRNPGYPLAISRGETSLDAFMIQSLKRHARTLLSEYCH